MVSKQPGVVPDIAIGRLPIYLRALTHLQAQGSEVTSSFELGRRLGIGSAQIRKDLSHFGGFGKQGTGYEIQLLIDQLRHVLSLNSAWQIAVIGAGNLGSAVSNYDGFTSRGFCIRWLFDTDPSRIGQEVGGLIVMSMDLLEATLCNNNVQIVMVAVPASQAQQVADVAVRCGVKAILNYAPISLQVPEHVRVQYIDPVVHLQHMTYYL